MSNLRISKVNNLEFLPLRKGDEVNIIKLFENDINSFITNEFKDISLAKVYVDSILSKRHKGFSFLIKNTEENKYIGIVDIYDLKGDDICQIEERCTLGLHMKEIYRNKGLGQTIINHMCSEIRTKLFRFIFLAYTNQKNIAAINFFKTLGFKDVSDDYFFKDIVYLEKNIN